MKWKTAHTRRGYVGEGAGVADDKLVSVQAVTAPMHAIDIIHGCLCE